MDRRYLHHYGPQKEYSSPLLIYDPHAASTHSPYLFVCFKVNLKCKNVIRSKESLITFPKTQTAFKVTCIINSHSCINQISIFNFTTSVTYSNTQICNTECKSSQIIVINTSLEQMCMSDGYQTVPIRYMLTQWATFIPGLRQRSIY